MVLKAVKNKVIGSLPPILIFLTSERSEEVPFLRGVGMMCGARGRLRTAVLTAELVLNFGIF